MSKSIFHFIFAVLVLSSLNTVSGDGANFGTSPLFEAVKFGDVERPRGLIVDSAGDVIVLGSQQISVFRDAGGDIEQSVLLDDSGLIGLGLNHGIAISKNSLYASSPTAVYRWPYTPGSRSQITAAPQTVVQNIPYGGYVTRTLIIDANDTMYISVGSRSDDNDLDLNQRALIKQIPNISNTGALNYSTLTNFVTGVRNTVGLAFDNYGDLWGVDNGINDFGPNINLNPADELNILKSRNTYGHPYCFTADKLPRNASGQYANPKYKYDGTHNDTWCNRLPTTTNNSPPEFSLPSHNAPLGINFYNGVGCERTKGSFPCSMTGDAFIAFHGSRNRNVPDGYFVGWLPFNNITKRPIGEIRPVIYEPNSLSCTSCFRPVNIVFDNQGRLIVSSDATNEIFRVSYRQSLGANAANGIFNFSIYLLNFIILVTSKIMLF